MREELVSVDSLPVLPEPMSFASIAAMLDRLRPRPVIVCCDPADELPIRRALRELSLTRDDVDLRVSQFVKPGRVIVANPALVSGVEFVPADV